jgi:MOSC domain-containing protein YiiM
LLNPASPLAALLDAPMRPGVVEWIGVRPGRREAMEVRDGAALDPEGGLAGDRYQGRGRARQVTLIGAEDLAAIASFLGSATIAPELVRRNVVVRGINLLALKGRLVRLGTAVLEITGECHPCSRMEAALGPGGYNAMRGRGGVTAAVHAAGAVALGDRLARDEELLR